jgi:hypothetical protein
MPYISQIKRENLNNKMHNLTEYLESNDVNIGEMNFIISNILNIYIQKTKKQDIFNYTVCNNLIGVLECAKLELYRKVISKYEDDKILENGDLYE